MRKAVLLLAGTAEAREISQRFSYDNLRLVASLAGVTRDPLPYPCETRMGGFGGVDAMAQWLRDENVAAVVDASHPFALGIAANANEAARLAGVPILVLRRESWEVEGREFASLAALSEALPAGACVMLTTGRGEMGPFLTRGDVSFVMRSIEPVADLPMNFEPIIDRPPFSFDDELTLMKREGITHLVTKDAGGARPAKLDAATALGLEIFRAAMPSPMPGTELAGSVDEALAWVDGLSEI